MGAVSKLDANLKIVYQSYVTEEQSRRTGQSSTADDELLFVLVQHTGNLSDLISAGLENGTSFGDNLAGGHVRLKNLIAVAELSNVVRIDSDSEEDEPYIATSVPEVQADQVWTLNRATGVFSGAGETGQGVIIGIIDSGIDINHTDFLSQVAPTKQTRILRIWDQGLDRAGAEREPLRALLSPLATKYGVEWNDTEINAHLNGGTAVRHKDCNGHGTHVASIAAGNGRADGLPREHVGIAPKADLVIVKFLSLEKDNPPSEDQRFIDAVHYIDNVVRTQLGNRPCVINYSAGSDVGPHDGLTSRELFLTNFFRGKRRRVMVLACGNSGNQQRHARITIPPAVHPELLGTIDVPFTLSDTRVNKTDRKRCAAKSNTRSLRVELWYPDVAGVTVQLKLPTEATFAAPSPATVRARGAANIIDQVFDGGKQFSLIHDFDDAVRPKEPAPLSLSEVTIRRSVIMFIVDAAGDLHSTGDYVFRLKGPAGTMIHTWCKAGKRHGFKLAAVLPPGVVVHDDSESISSPAGARHVLSIAAYNDVDGVIASFSSRGGLVDYSGAGNFPSKPELSAPGVHVSAARSDFSLIPELWGFTFPGHTFKSGTSMSAPHVAGAVALMMQKNENLSVAEAHQILTTAGQGVRAAVPQNRFGAGKLDTRGAVINTP